MHGDDEVPRGPGGSGGRVSPARGRPVRDLGDRVLLFDPEHDEQVRLTGSATVLWRLIGSGTEVAELRDRVAAIVGDGSPELDEAMRFVDDLVARGFLTRAG